MPQDQTIELMEAYTRASDRMNAKTFEFNAQPRYRNKNLLLNPKLLHEYNNSYAALFTKVLNEEVDKTSIRHSGIRLSVIHTNVSGKTVWKVVEDE